MLLMPLAIFTGCSSDNGTFAGTHWVYTNSYSSGGITYSETQELIFTSNKVAHSWEQRENGTQIGYGTTEGSYSKNDDTFESNLSYKGNSYKLSGEVSSNKLYLKYNGNDLCTLTKR